MSLVITFVIIIFFVYLKVSPKNKEKEDHFNYNKNYMAKKLYNNIKNNKSYHNNPDEIMQMQIDILALLYGDMIKDENIYKELIKKQRTFFSQEILNKNPFEMQYNNFLESTKKLKEDNIICIKISKDKAIYNKEKSKAEIKVEQIFNKIDKVESIYYLEKLDNTWKITSWEFINNNKDINNKKEKK